MDQKNDKISIIIVDDNRIVRKGLKDLLESQDDFQVVAEAAGGQEALKITEQMMPDVIMMDIILGDMNGVEATRKILRRNPEIRIIGLSLYDDRIFIDEMYRAGACGFLRKTEPIEHILSAIRNSTHN